MKQTYFPSSLLLATIFIPTSLSFAQLSSNNGQDEEHQRFDCRRQDPNNIPPFEKYSQPKELVFPLGYGTNHLNKVTNGT